MLAEIQSLRTKLERRKGQKEEKEKFIQNLKETITNIQRELRYIEESVLIIQTVSTQTQSELEYSISDLVTTALHNVMVKEPFDFTVKFLPKRGKTEAEFKFVQNGNEIDPILGSGFGAVDIAATALRFSLWNIRAKKYRPVFIMDEPAKHLKGKEMPILYAKMIKSISKTLGIQVVMVSHTESIIDEADRVFLVEKINGISEVRRI